MPLKTTGRRQFIRPKSLLSVAAAGLPLADALPESHLLRLSRPAMACVFEVLMGSSQRSRIGEVLGCLDIIHVLERQMTVFRNDSEIAEINRRAVQEPIRVEAELFGLLQLGRKLWQETDGAFDFTSGRLTRIWGFHLRSGAVPEPAEIARTLASMGADGLDLDSREQSVRFRKPGVELNLGAIGKGFALDRCGHSLRESGFGSFLLHAGYSSLLAHGHSPSEPQAGWPVGIRHPLRDGSIACVRLRNRAMATSGIREQHFVSDGKRYGHILDPRTGYPAEGCLSVTALAPSAAEADALSTAFFIMGKQDVERFCGRHPEIGALWIPAQKAPDEELQVHAFGVSPDDLEVYS